MGPASKSLRRFIPGAIPIKVPIPIHTLTPASGFRLGTPLGFTLIGMLVAMGILSILVGAVYTVVLSLQKGYDDQVALAEMQQQARGSLSIFSNEVQNAGLDPTGTAFAGTGTSTKRRHAPLFRAPLFNKNLDCNEAVRTANPIMEASPTVFHFMGDLDRSGGFNKDCPNCDENEDIRYEWVGKEGKTVCGRKKPPYTLYRYTGKNMEEVALGIREFHLAYYDEDDSLLSHDPDPLNNEERDNIRKVVLTVRALAGEGPNAQEREWTSEMILKNRG